MPDLPPPLTPSDCDLRDFPTLLVDVKALRDSRWHAYSAGEFVAGFCLMLNSWHQVPAASVPSDKRSLAELSQAGRNWWRVSAGALREFVLCSDGRYYHRRVAERANHAWAVKLRLQRRQVRRLEMESGLWSSLRAAVFRRDNYTCRYCGVRGMYIEADHVIPVAAGGRSTMDNLVTACRPCNRSKGAKALAAWLDAGGRPNA